MLGLTYIHMLAQLYRTFSPIMQTENVLGILDLLFETYSQVAKTAGPRPTNP